MTRAMEEVLNNFRVALLQRLVIIRGYIAF